MYNKPGNPLSLSGAGFEVNYDIRGLLRAALFMRRYAAPHLRSLSVGDVQTALRDFISSNFWIIADEAWDACPQVSEQRNDEAFSTFVSESTKKRLAEAIHASNLFVQPSQLCVFPLIVVDVAKNFDCSAFFFAEPAGLTLERLPSGYSAADVRSESFPPFARRNLSDQSPSSWLGIWGPTREAARRNRAAILGALALLPHRHERYLFTMRKMFGGYCVFDGSLTMVSSEPHTPALSENVVIGSEDHSWLTILADKIVSPLKADKRSMRALEYFYRAWVPDPTRRFPTLFGAIDAIYGDVGKATQAIIEAVGPVMGPDYDYQRLKVLLGLRASVVHGGAPNVYESSDYHRYYERYEEDATRDLELIVARCLQTVIFGSAMQERRHTYAELFKRETGRDI